MPSHNATWEYFDILPDGKYGAISEMEYAVGDVLTADLSYFDPDGVDPLNEWIEWYSVPVSQQGMFENSSAVEKKTSWLIKENYRFEEPDISRYKLTEDDVGNHIYARAILADNTGGWEYSGYVNSYNPVVQGTNNPSTIDT